MSKIINGTAYCLDCEIFIPIQQFKLKKDGNLLPRCDYHDKINKKRYYKKKEKIVEEENSLFHFCKACNDYLPMQLFYLDKNNRPSQRLCKHHIYIKKKDRINKMNDKDKERIKEYHKNYHKKYNK